MSETVTNEQAIAALNSIKEQFAQHLAYGYRPPEIHWGYLFVHTLHGEVQGRRVPCLITWKEGPAKWAHACPNGGPDEELTAERSWALGIHRQELHPAAQNWPNGVRAEPVGAKCLALHPA